MTAAALAIDDLHVRIPTPVGVVQAVSGVSLTVAPREFVGIVGESGSGKTTLALAALRLLSGEAFVSGAVRVNGVDVLTLGEQELRRLRGNRMGYVPQDPLISLDPTFGVGEQIAEAIRAHDVSASRSAARARAVELMHRVGIRDAARRYPDPPHTLSGGMRQRIAIAIAVANRPSLIIADEPTTALDVTIQRQVLELLATLAEQDRTAVCLITHDLGVVADLCDRVAVLYAGRIVELGPVDRVLDSPRHPYTRALLQAVPGRAAGRGRLFTIPGEVPDLTRLQPGCAFAPRCPLRVQACAERPALTELAAGWRAACWRPYDGRTSP